MDKNQKKNEDKDYIMQKFLKTADISKDPVHIKVNDEKTSPQAKKINTESIYESSLDKQESFFTKFLNKGLNKTKEAHQTDKIRPTTPVCNVVNRGDDSNDTDYSGSTINDEINKSIALFEDDPKDVENICNMREQLLNNTNRDLYVEDDTDSHLEDVRKTPVANDNAEEKPDASRPTNTSTGVLNTFECPECTKIIPMDMIDTHSDYHLALKLREEERQRVRNEIKDGSMKKNVPIVVKEKTNANSTKKKTMAEDHNAKGTPGPSIANFFVKFNDTVPVEICSECGKKVPIDKFAEHLDFHEAQKLSRELNKRDSPSYFVSNNVKRKKKSLSPVKKPKLACTDRSIDSFFR